MNYSSLPGPFRVACHTNFVDTNGLFFAIKGAQFDGVDYIPQAIQKGARLIVVDVESLPLPQQTIDLCASLGVVIESVKNIRRELAIRSAEIYDTPAKKLRIIGITGTKGKTTTTFAVAHLLRSAGYKVALLSTVYNQIDRDCFSASLTTQQPDYLHHFFYLCAQAGIEYVVMEVAAQAISLSRVEGIEFDAVMFTNFSKEHGEFYVTQEEYFAAKAELVNRRKPGAPLIVNGDDAWCRRLERCSDRYTISLAGKGDYRVTLHKLLVDSSLFSIINPCGAELLCKTVQPGEFNVYNLAMAVALVDQLGFSSSQISAGIETFSGAPGRLQLHKLASGARVYIDYAHNPSSFEAVLKTFRPFTDELIVVFGAGGDRDSSKRPIMGAVAAEYADVIFITSDNPRSEDPDVIINQIVAGIPSDKQFRVHCIRDRAEAIRTACAQARSEAIVLLLGKGPDLYQAVQGKKEYFNEAELLNAFL